MLLDCELLHLTKAYYQLQVVVKTLAKSLSDDIGRYFMDITELSLH